MRAALRPADAAGGPSLRVSVALEVRLMAPIFFTASCCAARASEKRSTASWRAGSMCARNWSTVTLPEATRFPARRYRERGMEPSPPCFRCTLSLKPRKCTTASALNRGTSCTRELQSGYISYTSKTMSRARLGSMSNCPTRACTCLLSWSSRSAWSSPPLSMSSPSPPGALAACSCRTTASFAYPSVSSHIRLNFCCVYTIRVLILITFLRHAAWDRMSPTFSRKSPSHLSIRHTLVTISASRSAFTAETSLSLASSPSPSSSTHK
mmetsp:Transcript_29512/g.82440  ORF Transcript_29512/g.82440 Transcript_29512/m.82440 type:complete len:267 (-) Transcript_29512:235-1035(-)